MKVSGIARTCFFIEIFNRVSRFFIQDTAKIAKIFFGDSFSGHDIIP